jgi:hypothetical protein
MTSEGETMGHRTIEGELAEPIRPEQLLVAYAELRYLLTALPDQAVDQMARAYDKGGRNRTYVQAADRAADLAYGAGLVDDCDQVVEVDDVIADLMPLSANSGHPLGGYALDLALAVLAYDQLDPADWELVTRWWVEVGIGLPQLPRRTAPVAVAPPAPEPEPARARRPARVAPQQRTGPDPHVQAVLDERAARRKYVKGRRRAAFVLWCLMLPAFMLAAGLAGRFTSWVPLIVGALAMLAGAVWAEVMRAQARRG